MKDILLTEDLDLDIHGGDLTIGNSDLQQQELLLINNKGNIKEFPTVGVDAFSFLQDNNTSALLQEIRRQFSADGMEVKAINITDTGQLNIDATYGNS
ncbi:hypothetical protein [Chitinophaga pinensis]|uniref:Oxidase n=1 Tax=Chitinophaga pinensis (strain ATCC 43595 / DSM 2588 / LMG 13176 / NBRC 15968 / NCIMB 11800 / UQM 2034) TaxID=485918 RepID=A0A979FZ70_CHIPD|nr:hypothetical protein [Chitinophaga pinensis]ACU57791.1 hypothetical protein Cpin_0292 [Chitinophaga pinensis DSM 2588]